MWQLWTGKKAKEHSREGEAEPHWLFHRRVRYEAGREGKLGNTAVWRALGTRSHSFTCSALRKSCQQLLWGRAKPHVISPAISIHVKEPSLLKTDSSLPINCLLPRESSILGEKGSVCMCTLTDVMGFSTLWETIKNRINYFRDRENPKQINPQLLVYQFCKEA